MRTPPRPRADCHPSATYRRGTAALLSAFLICTLSACGGGGDGGGSSSEASPAPATPSPGASAPPVAADAINASILSFAVDSRLKLNALGGVSLEAFPVALFRDGRALIDTAGLIYPGGLEAHRIRYPDTWTQWRASGADVQVRQADGSWKTITASNVIPPASESTRLAAAYTALSVASSANFGMTLIASEEYTFTDVGAVARGQFNVGTSANVGAFATTPDRRGNYAIQGYRLSITYENGVREERAIVFNPARPEFVFIDGAMYSSN